MSISSKDAGGLSFFEFVGIPRSWLSKRPKLPSRNWLIFITFASSLTSTYIYDRRQCKKLKQAYIDKVKHLSEVPLQSWELPRKITVYTTKWPGDDDYERGATYFKKYVKPVLVAAAIDYEIVSGKRHGTLAERITSQIRERRRRAAGLDPPFPGNILLGSKVHTPELEARRFLEGGIIIVGRSTFKEYMEGLRRGWTDGLEVIDKEEALAQILSEDNIFDDSQPEEGLVDGQFLPKSPLWSPPQLLHHSPKPTKTSVPIPAGLNMPPDTIPPQPPLLLLPFLNRIGFKQIPMMVVEFFNRRKDVREGGEAALTLIGAKSRAFLETDLDWAQDSERYYKFSVHNIPSEIEKSRESFYKELHKKLATARALARNDREPTKDELSFPPPTEVELRAERLKKELRWRDDLGGWKIVQPESSVVWDQRFPLSLRVFKGGSK